MHSLRTLRKHIFAGLAAVLMCTLGPSSGPAEAAQAGGRPRLPPVMRETMPAIDGGTARVPVPRGSAYHRGIALDAAGRHLEALQAYEQALTELPALADRAGASEPVRQAWRARIVWQRDASEDLVEVRTYLELIEEEPEAYAHLGEAYHAKHLAARAVRGRVAKPLWEGARRAYERALALDPGCATARLGLARLFAEVGQGERARAEFGRAAGAIGARRFAGRVAAYHAALGDTERAVVVLLRADDAETVRAVRGSEAYDTLRDDPRVGALLAAPPAPAPEVVVPDPELAEEADER